MSFELYYTKDLNKYKAERWKTSLSNLIFSEKYYRGAIVEKRSDFSGHKTNFSASFLLPLKNEDGIILDYYTTKNNSYDIEKEAVKEFDSFIESILVRMGGIQLMIEKQIIEKPKTFIKKINYINEAEVYIVKEINRSYDIISYLVYYFPYGSDYNFAFARELPVRLNINTSEFTSFFEKQAQQDMKNYIQEILESYTFAGHLLGMGRFVE